MRPSISTLVLLAAVALSGCGDDEEPPPQAQIPRPTTPVQPPAPDTTLGDTATRVAGQPGAPGQAGGTSTEPGAAGTRDPSAAPGQAGRQQGRAGQAEQAPAPAGQPPAPGQRLYTVQVAAFTSPDSAQKWTGRLNSLDLPVWMSMAELGGTTYYRVRVGAVPTFTEARQLGALITRRFEWPVWVAPVTASDRMPPDAVASTRRVLTGD